MSQLALIPTDGSFTAGTASTPEPERVLLDALAYFDAFDETDQQRAEALIQQELLTFAPPNYLADRPEHKVAFAVRSSVLEKYLFFLLRLSLPPFSSSLNLKLCLLMFLFSLLFDSSVRLLVSRVVSHSLRRCKSRGVRWKSPEISAYQRWISPDRKSSLLLRTIAKMLVSGSWRSTMPKHSHSSKIFGAIST